MRNENLPTESRLISEDDTAPSQHQNNDTQVSVETEETLEDEIEGEELPDTTNPTDGRIPLRIEEECKNGRFKRVHILAKQSHRRGAYKTVYRALDEDTGKEVAWNVINVERLPKADKKRVYDEVTLLKKLSHPNIMQGIATWYDPDKQEVVFITELVVASLKSYILRIKDSKPKLKAIKGWCREILKGLKYLHEQDPPIIHRDIKCDNIFINTNIGGIKIGDLGLATTLKREYAESLVGTPEYMAPELYEEKYTTKVDVYAFGMCLLEMITLEVPYRECMNVGIIYQKVINGILPESLRRVENEEVRKIILWCLTKAEQRPTVQQLLEHPFFADQDDPSNDKEIVVKPTEPPKKIVKEEAVSKVPVSPVVPRVEPPPERISSAKKRIKRTGMPSHPSDKKAKLQVDPFFEQMDFFKKISKNNMASFQQSKRSFDNQSAKEEVKGKFEEEEKVLPEIRAEDLKYTKEVSQPLEYARMNSSTTKRQNNSMIILKKEFFRAAAEDTGRTVTIKMLIEGKDNEVLQLQFDYNLSKDSPGSVAKEMVKALCLPEEEIPRIQAAIQEELSNREESKTTEKTKEAALEQHKMKSQENSIIEEDSQEDNKAAASYEWEKDAHDRAQKIADLAKAFTKKSDLVLEKTKTLEELDNAFLIEIAKLCQRYKVKEGELENNANGKKKDKGE